MSSEKVSGSSTIFTNCKIGGPVVGQFNGSLIYHGAKTFLVPEIPTPMETDAEEGEDAQPDEDTQPGKDEESMQLDEEDCSGVFTNFEGDVIFLTNKDDFTCVMFEGEKICLDEDF